MRSIPSVPQVPPDEAKEKSISGIGGGGGVILPLAKGSTCVLKLSQSALEL